MTVTWTLTLGLLTAAAPARSYTLWFSTMDATVGLGAPSSVTRGAQGITLTTASGYFGGYRLDLGLAVPSNVEVTGVTLCYATSGSSLIQAVDLYESADPPLTVLHAEPALMSSARACTTLQMTPHTPGGPLMISVTVATLGSTTATLGAIGLEVEPISVAVESFVPRTGPDPGWSVPNPTTGGATIEFESPMEESARLEIFDVTGRLLKTVDSMGPPTGRRRVSWDGRDEAGRRVTPGVYLYRVVTSRSVSGSRRLTIVR